MSALSKPLQIFLGSFVFVYLILCSLQITQVDIWWHLEEGMRLLHTFSLPTQPAAAFGLPARPFFDEYAGYEMVLTLFYQAVGFPGLWVLFSAIYLLILFLPSLSSGERYPSFDLLSNVSFLFAGLLLKYRLAERPELVGSLLLVLLMLLLRRSHLESFSPRFRVYLFLVFAVWTNTHSTFVIGFFVLFLWIGCEMMQKIKRVSLMTMARSAAWMIGSAGVATCLNPYGPRRLLFPFAQAADPGSTALSTEMWPITDFHTPIGLMVLLATAFLVLAFLTGRGMPVWLMIFSLVSFYLALRNFRFISLLVTALLFAVSARDANRRMLSWPWPWPLVLLKNLGICFLCLFMLYGDGFSLVEVYKNARAQEHFATNSNIYVPRVVETARPAIGEKPPVVLCGQCEGSYLSFPENGRFHPLIDSGLAHFSDETKRYFFFLLQEPEALTFALDHLPVDSIIIGDESFHWLMVLQRSPHWKLITWDENGMLWRRENGRAASGLDPSQSQMIARACDALLKEHEIIRAFCYSTLEEQPLESLRIISDYGGAEWSSSFYNYFSAWVDALPEASIRQFLATNGSGYPLVDAMLQARLGSATFASFNQTAPEVAKRSWQWKLVEVRDRLAAGDREGARTLFDSISPRPISSVSYYKFWQKIKTADAGEYGRWQMWNDKARVMMKITSADLSTRITLLDGAAAP